MPPTLDAQLLGDWIGAATAALERHCDEIDRINVFPVPDGDTGTNLLLTIRSAGDAIRRGAPAGPLDGATVAAAMARGALVGARGNSGVILSQVLRGFAEAIFAAGTCATGTAAAGSDAGAGAGGRGGPVLADALARAHRLATAALSRPREGTVLTVLAAAAAAAACPAGAGPAGADPAGPAPADRHGLAAAAVAAADAASRALSATTSQLPELARAGVVDAGGLGLHLVLDALAGLVTGRPPAEVSDASIRPRLARSREALVAERDGGSTEYDHEVMYLLDGTDPQRVAVLRAELEGLGDCVAVVGDGIGTGGNAAGGGLWTVHVHCSDIGAAIEAGIAAGRPHRVTVMRLVVAVDGTSDADRDPADGRFVRGRAVLMTVAGPQVAALARDAGADVLERGFGEAVEVAELAAALAGSRARNVVLVCDDPDLTGNAEQAAAAARRDGQEVLVVPTSSVLQGLAALAVHDPARRPGADVVAMAEAAASTRTGGLLVAESEALTWVGRCQPGEVLGLTDGEVVLIAPDLAVGALWLAHRMLTAGGELVTVLLGAAADPALGDGLAADLRRTHPEVDVVVLAGGQTDYPIVLGVE